MRVRKSRWFLSFGHNLCFKCPNGQCEPILDIYVSIAFQWCKEHFEPLGFDLCNRSLNIRESTRTPIPKMGIHLGVWGFFPHILLHSQGHENATPGLRLGSHPCKIFCLGRKPKAKVATLAVGPLNEVKGDFGKQSLRPSGKFGSGINPGKRLGY